MILSLKYISRSKLCSTLVWGLCLSRFASLQADTIVVYGATGAIGSKIVTEALDRGHDVIGVSRNPESFDIDHANFRGVAAT